MKRWLVPLTPEEIARRNHESVLEDIEGWSDIADERRGYALRSLLRLADATIAARERSRT